MPYILFQGLVILIRQFVSSEFGFQICKWERLILTLAFIVYYIDANETRTERKEPPFLDGALHF